MASEKAEIRHVFCFTFFPRALPPHEYSPRANGAKRRSGRKPGARVTNSALAFTYIRIMRCYIAQWHSGISFNVMRMRESRPRKSWKLAAS